MLNVHSSIASARKPTRHIAIHSSRRGEFLLIWRPSVSLRLLQHHGIIAIGIGDLLEQAACLGQQILR